MSDPIDSGDEGDIVDEDVEESDSDLADYGYDDDDEPPRKKQRNDASRFLDTEVSESDEEDETYPGMYYF